MRSLQHISQLSKLNGILQAHGRKVVDDGRMLTVIHKAPSGKMEISRHHDIPALIEKVWPATQDERLIQFTQA